MFKPIRECSFTQIFTYVNENLVGIQTEEIMFPKTLTMIMCNPNIHELGAREKNKVLKQIFSEIKAGLLETLIEVDDE